MIQRYPLADERFIHLVSFPDANPDVFIIKQPKIEHGIYKVALGNKK